MNETAMIVIGELSRNPGNSLDVIKEFVSNGGSAFCVKSGAMIIFPDVMGMI